MAQPPVIYKPGRLNYVWNWVGRTLNDFTRALVPYIIKTGLVLKGKSYVFVNANGTPEQNGNELKAAYDTAKTMNPTADSRISVIAAPGNYFLSSNFELDTDFIDLVSLDGNRSIIIDGYFQASQIYYFSDDGNWEGYDISEGGNDMYDTGNFISADGNQIAYTHTQLQFDQSGGIPTSISRINTFTYTATGTSAADNTYTCVPGDSTTGNGVGACFNIEVISGVVTNVYLDSINNGQQSQGIDYAVNDTITILGSTIGGVDGVDDIIITVTSLIGYFNVNTSFVSGDETSTGSIDTFTYVATGTTAGNGNYGPVLGLTNNQGRYGSFSISVVGGAVTSVDLTTGYNGTGYLAGAGYQVNDTITILGSQINGTDGVDDVVITVTGILNPFGSTASYFTNMYPGFFFMGAQNTSINQFTIYGGLGADGGGFLNSYNYSQGGLQVYVKRVGGTSDPSVNHIIIVNPSDASQITQTVSPSTNDDDHELTGLISGNVTEIYHMVFSKAVGCPLSNDEVTNIVSEFLAIRNSSGTTNELLTNLNSSYSNLTQQVVPVSPAFTIFVTANDVFIKGVDVLEKQFKIGDNLDLLRVENCSGGAASFGANGISAAGTFVNCRAGNASFGGGGKASGTFIDCIAGNVSFGFGYSSSQGATGTFINCIGGNESFGVGAGGSSGTFTNCIGGDSSFGYNGIASGTYTDCVGGIQSFGYQGTASGIFTNCIADDDGFGGNGTANGTFINCRSGIRSYGYNAVGTFTNCIGGDDSFGSYGTASGTFNNCIGGDDSFGGKPSVGTLTGKLYYCRLTSGSFQTLTGTGLMRACVDGNDVFIPSLDA